MRDLMHSLIFDSPCLHHDNVISFFFAVLTDFDRKFMMMWSFRTAHDCERLCNHRSETGEKDFPFSTGKIENSIVA